MVVAIAGMILPAISGCYVSATPLDHLLGVNGMGSRFVSNFDLGSIPKTVARRLAQAVTKSNVSTSSLSKTRIGFTSPVEDFWRLFSRVLSRPKLDFG